MHAATTAMLFWIRLFCERGHPGTPCTSQKRYKRKTARGKLDGHEKKTIDSLIRTVTLDSISKPIQSLHKEFRTHKPPDCISATRDV